MEEQTSILKTLLEAWIKQEKKLTIRHWKQKLVWSSKSYKPSGSNVKQSRMNCAGLNRTISHPSNATSLSSNYTTQTTFTSTLYCTIDTSTVETDASDQVFAGAIRKMWSVEFVASRITFHGDVEQWSKI
jgi:hypothetical protein